jgi:ribosome biogenesis GTPase / thiamine phosphate phosphatase
VSHLPDLAALGWTPAREAEFAPWASQGLAPGRVSLEHNHVYRVMTAGGERLAEAAGRMKQAAEARLPVVGDWVALKADGSDGRCQIRHVLTRRTWFSRKVAGRTTVEQVLAANIDTVFVVFGLDGPMKSRAIERYLVVALKSGATPVVVLNKVDLAADPAASAREAAAAAGPTRVVAVSAHSGDGMDDLASYLDTGRTLALLGPSGAGKSSLVNRLVGEPLLPTGDVREWDARGRHTSVHRQLVVRAAGGLIIDTPGIRELQLWDGEGVVEAFDDIAALAGTCRFRDCRHDREPGCAVKAAVEADGLDAGRYQGFLKLQREQEEIERKREARAQGAPGRRDRGAQDGAGRKGPYTTRRRERP